jgi:sporulation protein YlmC with PRC-barrel domain
LYLITYMEIKMADAIQWDKVMGKKVRSIDGEDIGKVENVNTDSIEVKDGLIAIRHYYIPKHSIQGFDGDDNLITTMTKKDIHDKFSADNPVADLWKAPKD